VDGQRCGFSMTPSSEMYVELMICPEVGGGDLGGEQVACRPVGVRGEVERVHHLVLGAPLDAQPAVGGDVAAEMSEEVAGLGMAVVHGVEEVDREGEHVGERSLVDRRDGVQAVAGGPLQPGVCGDGWVVGCDAVGGGRDRSGDLQ